MARQLNIQSREHDGAGKPAPWNAILAGSVLLAILTMLISVAFGIGLGTIDPAIEVRVLNGADASATPLAFVAVIIGCCVCARRDCGRTRPRRASSAPDARATALPDQLLSGSLSERPANALADSDT